MSNDEDNPHGSPDVIPPGSPVQGDAPEQGGFGQAPQGQPPSQGGFGQPQAPQGGQPQGQNPPQSYGYGQGQAGHIQPGYGTQGQSAHVGYAAPHGQAPEIPSGLKITAIVLLIISPIITGVAMIPCLGILNWLAIPTNGALAIIGILGLAIGPKLQDGKPANMQLHIGAIVGGVVLGALSFLRCLWGGGVA